MVLDENPSLVVTELTSFVILEVHTTSIRVSLERACAFARTSFTDLEVGELIC